MLEFIYTKMYILLIQTLETIRLFYDIFTVTEEQNILFFICKNIRFKLKNIDFILNRKQYNSHLEKNCKKYYIV